MAFSIQFGRSIIYFEGSYAKLQKVHHIAVPESATFSNHANPDDVLRSEFVL